MIPTITLDWTVKKLKTLNARPAAVSKKPSLALAVTSTWMRSPAKTTSAVAPNHTRAFVPFTCARIERSRGRFSVRRHDRYLSMG